MSDDAIRVGISSCLLGNSVRYDGGHKLDCSLRDTLGAHVEWVPVCPEVEYGLPIPREALRLVGDPADPRLVTSHSGVDHTVGMKAWAAQRLDALEREKLCAFGFKSRSERLFVVASRPHPRFLCDVMLGRLARWLRALGHDTAYDHTAGDDALLRRAVHERRILVTRDTRLATAPRGPRRVLLHANDTSGQLRELVDTLGIKQHPGLLTRCIVCNTRLRTATAGQIEERVPEYVRSVHQVFHACPGCGRVYWAGTHRPGILAALESALPGVTGHGPDAEPRDLTSR